MHRVLLVGDSLFADTLMQMLSVSGEIEVVGVCTSPEPLAGGIATGCPDAVVVAGGVEPDLYADAYLRMRCELPIIYTTLADDYLTVFTSRRVKAAQSHLLAAISALPKQN